MFMVKVDMWNNCYEDTYDCEYSGIEHTTREEAEKELAKAKEATKDDKYIESIYIVEV